MTHAAILFVSSFFLVMALGWQSMHVNGGHYRAAFLNSLLIGGGQMVLYKLAPNADMLEIAAYLTGGPFGIIAAMWSHQHIFKGRPKHPSE